MLIDFNFFCATRNSHTISNELVKINKSSQWHLRQAGRVRRRACRFAFGIPSPLKWPKPCPSPDRSQCRLFPQQRTFRNATVMSALCQHRTFACSLNYLIGTGDEGRRHGKPQLVGCLEVDGQLECGCLVERDVAGLCSSENCADIVADALIQFDQVE
jgi:hypothetical protein